MFRDDLESALARANHLEKELHSTKARAEAAEGRVASLEAQLKEHQKELTALRKKAGVHRGQNSDLSARRRGLIAFLSVAGLVALVMGGFCIGGKKKVRTRRVQLREPPAPLGVEKVNFAEYVQQVASRCDVSYTGWISRCKPADLRKALPRAEERVGAQAALMGYCQLLGKKGKVSILAANRIGSFLLRRIQAVDAKVFRCLDSYVRNKPKTKGLKSVVFSWARLGVLHGKKDAVLKWIEGRSLKVRKSGYRALWQAGRLEVLEDLAPLLVHQDPLVVEAALEGFQSLSTDKQREAVCPLFARILATSRVHRLTALAAYRSAQGCRGRNNTAVLAVAKREILREGALNYWWVAALGVFGNGYARTTATQRKEATRLLAGVVDDGKRSPYRRSQALRGLSKVNPKRGQELAGRYAQEKVHALRRAARRILTTAPR